MTIIEKTKTVVTTRRHLKVVGRSSFRPDTRTTFAMNGQIVPVGAIVEVSMDEATDLIQRSIAVDATAPEVAAAGENILVSPSQSDRWQDA